MRRHTPTNPATAELRSRQQAARQLGVSERTLAFWTSQGALPVVKLGPRTIRYSLADLERFIQERRQQG